MKYVSLGIFFFMQNENASIIAFYLILSHASY